MLKIIFVVFLFCLLSLLFYIGSAAWFEYVYSPASPLYLQDTTDDEIDKIYKQEEEEELEYTDVIEVYDAGVAKNVS
jgi:hypothetical protein